MTVYIPYRAEPLPQTTDLRELRAALDRARAIYGRGSLEGLEAYQRLSREAGQQGQPLDGLRRYVANEVERFFAQTIQGPDGHVYWDGRKRFERNDGRGRLPIRWWWEHTRGPLLQHDDVWATCGDTACINPEHAERGRSPRRMRYSEREMLGALQVIALRLGHTPTIVEWRRLHASVRAPHDRIYGIRFGAWTRAIRQAGLVPPKLGQSTVTEASAVGGLRLVRELVGHWDFTRDDYEARRDALREAGYPSSGNSVTKQLGHWQDALRKAGKP